MTPGPGSRRRRRSTASGQASHERWLVSYADFMTLLFAFFTTMYAISTVDSQKMSKMVESMQTAFASTGGEAPPTHDTAVLAATPALNPRAANRVDERALARQLSSALGGDLVEVTLDQRGVVVSIREAGSFPTGTADLSPVALDVLGRMADTVRGLPNALRVEGHTDDVPVRAGKYASNWELSTARATAVVQFLASDGGLYPHRLSAAGYGEYHARVPNDSDVKRASNRRVDVVILNAETVRDEEPARGAAPQRVVP